MTNQFMYAIASRETGPVKMGISADPDRRLRDLQTGHPEPLTVYYREPVAVDRVRLYERLLHRDNAHTRRHGEWFNLSVEQATAYIIFTPIEYDLVPTETLRRQLTHCRY